MNNISTPFALIFLPFAVLLPGYEYGQRTFFFFEIFLLSASFFLIISLAGKIEKRYSVFFLLTGVLISFAIIFQIYFYGGIQSLSTLRVSVLLLSVFFVAISTSGSSLKIKNNTVLVMIIAAAIAYAQVIDNTLFGGGLNVSQIVAKLYPYRGELSDRSLSITDGLSLKTNSAFSPTSIVDGHTILAGNFFAIISVIAFFWRKPYLAIAAALITVLTFSRGSWGMLFIGVSFWILTIKWKINLVSAVKYATGLLIAVTLFINTHFWQYLVFRTNNTLFALGFTDMAVGNPIDPRTTRVWPEFIRAMNDIGAYSWIIGGNLSIPTDSGFLLVLREQGVLGFAVIASLLLYGYLVSGRDRLVLCLIFMIVAGSIVNPVIQGHRLLFLFGLVVLVQSRMHLESREVNHRRGSQVVGTGALR